MWALADWADDDDHVQSRQKLRGRSQSITISIENCCIVGSSITGIGDVEVLHWPRRPTLWNRSPRLLCSMLVYRLLNTLIDLHASKVSRPPHERFTVTREQRDLTVALDTGVLSNDFVCTNVPAPAYVTNRP
jgi:hypothetical protein